MRGSREFLEGWIQVPDIDEDPDGVAWLDRTLAAAGDERFEKLVLVLRDGAVVIGALNFNEIVRGSFKGPRHLHRLLGDCAAMRSVASVGVPGGSPDPRRGWVAANRKSFSDFTASGLPSAAS